MVCMLYNRVPQRETVFNRCIYNTQRPCVSSSRGGLMSSSELNWSELRWEQLLVYSVEKSDRVERVGRVERGEERRRPLIITAAALLNKNTDVSWTVA